MLGRQEESVAGSGVAGGRAEDGGALVRADASAADSADGGAELGGSYQPLKIAAIYARVSTERQEKEQTVESQLDALHRAASEGGYEVAPSHVFVDERRSGAHLDRPGLDRLRDLASEGAFEAVLIASPDRLATTPTRSSWSKSSKGLDARWCSPTTPSARLQRSGCCCRYRESLPSTNGR